MKLDYLKKKEMGLPMYAWVAIAAVVIFVGYRWFKNRSSSAATTSTPTTGSAGTGFDYGTQPSDLTGATGSVGGSGDLGLSDPGTTTTDTLPGSGVSPPADNGNAPVSSPVVLPSDPNNIVGNLLTKAATSAAVKNAIKKLTVPKAKPKIKAKAKAKPKPKTPAKKPAPKPTPAKPPAVKVATKTLPQPVQAVVPRKASAPAPPAKKLAVHGGIG